MVALTALIGSATAKADLFPQIGSKYTVLATMAGAKSEDDLKAGLKILNQGDNDAFVQMMEDGEQAGTWKLFVAGQVVTTMDYDVWGELVQIRANGDYQSYWFSPKILDLNPIA